MLAVARCRDPAWAGGESRRDGDLTARPKEADAASPQVASGEGTSPERGDSESAVRSRPRTSLGDGVVKPGGSRTDRWPSAKAPVPKPDGCSAGTANYAPRHKLDEHFTFCVPQGRPINPVTHTNWEGIGVAPDVVVDPKAALREAHVRALGALIASLPAGPRRGELEKVLAQVRDVDAGAVP